MLVLGLEVSERTGNPWVMELIYWRENSFLQYKNVKILPFKSSDFESNKFLLISWVINIRFHVSKTAVTPLFVLFTALWKVKLSLKAQNRRNLQLSLPIGGI